LQKKKGKREKVKVISSLLFGEDCMSIKIINARKVRLTEEDYRSLAEIEKHPEVAKWNIPPSYGGNVEKLSAIFKESIENLSETENEFLVAKLDGRVVGFAGIRRLKGETGELRHVGEIGISVHPDFQQRGIGTKLLKASVSLAIRRGFKRLEADTLAHNKAMRRILEKTGFKLEGVKRKRIKINGNYFDEACYGALT
jgi:RimJ/RimL family protein N-acetyltransferase